LPPRQGIPSHISLAVVILVVLLALGAGLGSVSLIAAPIRYDFTWIATVAIFVSSYAALAVGRIPGLALDRAGITLVGAALMVACGALPLADAYKAVDLDTLTLLLGMMIVVAHLRLSGFLSRANRVCYTSS
jgi:di/tricarboxylate transporter